jgi:hypothetical protein
MADIQTALREALQEWDTGKDSTTKEETTMQTQPKYEGFKVTTNVGRRTFDLVKNNPGIMPHEITGWAKKEGLNPESAYAMAAKSVRDAYMVRDAKGGFHTIIPEYKSPKTKTKKKMQTQSTKPTKKPESKGIKALLGTPQQGDIQEALATLARPETKQELTNEYILSKIGVKQALSLYMELIDIFTGKQYERK